MSRPSLTTDSLAFEAVRDGLVEDASTSDRDWFRRNPWADHYVRDYRPGEFDSDLSDRIAHDLRVGERTKPPGTRLRVVIVVTTHKESRTRRPYVVAVELTTGPDA